MSLNQELAELFKTAAAVMEIKGESVFKAIAFTKVARVLNDMTIDIRQCVEDQSLCNMEGIGAASQRIIEEYVKTGRSKDVDELRASIPPGLIPMLQIPSLGPKTIALLWKERNICTIEDLAKGIEEGKLAGIKGLGEKKIQSIKEGIAMRAQAAGRQGLVNVLPIAVELLDRVRQLNGVKQAEIAGSLRRWKETIGDVDIVATLENDAKQSKSATSKSGGAASAAPSPSAEITQAFTHFPQVSKILGQGETKASVLVENNLQVDLRIVPEEHFGAALQYFTGSKEHNVKLRGLAQDKGLTLNEWGLYKIDEYEKVKKQTGKPPTMAAVASRTEEEIYEALGMDWIPAELREGRDELELAKKKKLPELIVVEDIKGDLHTHTTASDGTATIDQMAEAAKAMGYAFLGITDHSKSQVIANGLTAERLLKHVKAIRAVAAKMKGIRILAGCEVDILPDGTLDFEEVVLAELDFVIASPHISLKQDATKATDRLLRAIESRYVNIIGHPTGRMINARAGLPVVFEKVLARAAEAGVAMEINAGWPRLDLNDVNARAAIQAGGVLSINTDAHSTDEFSQMPLGISVARRAGAAAANVLNTWSYSALTEFIARKR